MWPEKPLDEAVAAESLLELGVALVVTLFFGFIIPMLLFAAVVNPMRIIFLS